MRTQRVHPLAIAAGAAVVAGLAVRSVVRARRYFDLRDRTVFITGGSRGLGLAQSASPEPKAIRHICRILPGVAMKRPHAPTMSCDREV
jgi:hypothetical protein